MKNAKNKNKNTGSSVGVGVKHDHPGRPRYEMVFPATATFTFTELMAANGVDTHKYLKNGHANSNYGKGENCTMLTCRKNLKFDLARGEVCLMKGYTAKPDSDDGLGRRGLLYRHVSTAFNKALDEAKIRGAEGLADEVPAPKAKGKTRTATPVSAKSAVDKMVTDAKAILAEPASTVVIAPSPIPDAVHNPLNAAPAAPEVAPVTVPAAPAAHAATEVSVPLAEPVSAAPVAEAVSAPAPEAAPVVPAETAPVVA